MCLCLCVCTQLDGYDSLSNQSTDMLKGKVRVTFVDDEGAQEAGVVST